MEGCLSETTSETTGDIVAGNPFFGKSRMQRDYDRDGISSQICLDQRVWSKLPEELLLHIFARLPVNDIILRIRSLNKSWRSTITSPEFLQAFVDASVVRVALMVSDEVDGTMFLTQENKVSRDPELTEETIVAATADGLVWVIEEEEPVGVLVMNVVTGVRRELRRPPIVTLRPTLVRMETNVAEGGYTITFINTKDYYASGLEVTSWAVYDSVKNIWRKDGVEPLAHLKDVEVFSMYDCEGLFYENMAIYHKETKKINVFNLQASSAHYDGGIYIPDPDGHVHTVSGELYKVCMREEKHGVWKLTSSGRWEMVCEFPEVEDVRTCLRVLNDGVVLVFKFPDQFQYKDRYGEQLQTAGSIVKVFHMPSKSWHTFPEADTLFRTREGTAMKCLTWPLQWRSN